MIRPAAAFAATTIAALVLTAFAAGQTTRVSSVRVNFPDGTHEDLYPPAATQPTPTPSIGPFLGVNLNTPNDWDVTQVFADAMRTARRPGSTSRPYDESAITDADGWANGDAGYRVLTTTPRAAGDYRLSFDGPAQVTAIGGKVTGLAFNGTKGTATVTIATTQPANLDLIFKGTSGGVKNIVLMRPGSRDGDLLSPLFLQLQQPFGGFRMMDFARTNDSLCTTWSSYPQPERATWRDGVPYAVQIRIGQQLNKPVWINLPAMADDDFIRHVGAMIAATPETGPPVIVELSNETWNGQFKQCNQIRAMAKARIAAGDRTLDATNDTYAGWQMTALRDVEIKRIIPRAHVVLASQLGYDPPGTVVGKQIGYIADNFGPPANFIDAIAEAPYWSPGRNDDGTWYTSTPGVTADGIAQRLLDKSRGFITNNARVTAFKAIATRHGVGHWGYEGGLDLQQFPNDIGAKIASQYDPRTGQAVETYLADWFANVRGPMMYFNLGCLYSKSGYWGLVGNDADPTVTKYQAAQRAAAAATRPTP